MFQPRLFPKCKSRATERNCESLMHRPHRPVSISTWVIRTTFIDSSSVASHPGRVSRSTILNAICEPFHLPPRAAPLLRSPNHVDRNQRHRDREWRRIRPVLTLHSRPVMGRIYQRRPKTLTGSPLMGSNTSSCSFWTLTCLET
jgi:hypothetical protein